MLALIIIGVLLIFTFLVVAHEFGHFLVARREGVRVREFGVGFPPRLFSRKKNGTIFSINALPLGGFVRLKGEDGEEKGKDSFTTQGFWAKTRIIMAGVVVNLAIAYLIFTFLLIIGIPPLGQKLPSLGAIKPQSMGDSNLVIYNVSKDSAALRSDLRQGDSIISIDDMQILDNSSLRSFTSAHQGQTVDVSLRRNGQLYHKSVTLGSDQKVGYLGVSAEKTQLSRYPFWAAPIASIILMLQFVWATLAAFGGLIVGLFVHHAVSDQVTGPIGIVSLFSQVVNFGPRFMLLFIASISLSLGVVNALPIPALDGGRQFVLILKKIGFKISPEREGLVHFIGFIALISLMVIISIGDIIKLR